MASRTFSEFNATFLKRVVNLYCRVVLVGTTPVLQKWQYASGSGKATANTYAAAPTTGVGNAMGNGEGIRSVVRTAAGAWTITLQDSYQRCVQLSANFTLGAGSFAAAPIYQLVSTTNTQRNNAIGDGGIINILFQAAAGGGGVDPSSGETIDFNITLHDGTAI